MMLSEPILKDLIRYVFIIGISLYSSGLSFYEIMKKYGKVKMFEKDYTVFRGGNIKSNKRSNIVKELLFLLKKV